MEKVTLDAGEMAVVMTKFEEETATMTANMKKLSEKFDNFDGFKSDTTKNLRQAFEDCSAKLKVAVSGFEAEAKVIADKRKWLLEDESTAHFTKVSNATLDTVMAKYESVGE